MTNNSTPPVTDSSRVLILFAHPALEKSRANRRLISVVQDIPGVTFHDLYEAYPDFHIDVDREQALLTEHQTVIMQHPFYWYSTPALLKEWEDLVLKHGWAYGSEGKALHGKVLASVITTGGREEAYCSQGYNRFTMRQLLTPIEQTARLCGMRYLAPFVVHGTLEMEAAAIDSHAADYRRTVEALRDDRVDLEKAEGLQRLNYDLSKVLKGGDNAQ